MRRSSPAREWFLRFCLFYLIASAIQLAWHGRIPREELGWNALLPVTFATFLWWSLREDRSLRSLTVASLLGGLGVAVLGTLAAGRIVPGELTRTAATMLAAGTVLWYYARREGARGAAALPAEGAQPAEG